MTHHAGLVVHEDPRQLEEEDKNGANHTDCEVDHCRKDNFEQHAHGVALLPCYDSKDGIPESLPPPKYLASLKRLPAWRDRVCMLCL